MTWTPEDVRGEAQRIRETVTEPGQPVNYPLVDVIALLTRVSELLAGSADMTRMRQLELRVAELERRNTTLRAVVEAAAQDGSVAYMANVVERARALLRDEPAPTTAGS